MEIQCFELTPIPETSVTEPIPYVGYDLSVNVISGGGLQYVACQHSICRQPLYEEYSNSREEKRLFH